MSQTKAPHYSHIVHDINSRGGLKMHFGRRGHQGEGWIRHLNTVVPANGVLLHELHSVDHPHQQESAFHNALQAKATERGATILPAGFYGDHKTLTNVPTFTSSELLQLMPKSAQHLTSATLKKYQKLQSIREMRAAVGSLAWLAAHMGAYTAQPVVLWGRTHSVSLPDIYQRLGIHTVEVNHLDAPLRYTYLQPHGLNWSDQTLQTVFEHAYSDAISYTASEVTAVDT